MKERRQTVIQLLPASKKTLRPDWLACDDNPPDGIQVRGMSVPTDISEYLFPSGFVPSEVLWQNQIRADPPGNTCYQYDNNSSAEFYPERSEERRVGKECRCRRWSEH